MQFKLFVIIFSLSGILLAQTNIVTTEYGNLTIEWDKKLEDHLASKEKEICLSDDPNPIEVIPEFCRGARVQVFYSKSRSEAESKLKELKSLFPNEFSNLEFNSPDYKVKMGHFESREAAQSILNKARRAFPSALIVEETVRCSLID